MKRILIATLLLLVTVALWWVGRPSTAEPISAPSRSEASSLARQLTMAEVLDMARAARGHMTETLDDYTARFVKQELDTSGVLGEQAEIHMKVQTRLRGDAQDAPMRVFLNFQSPESVKGRKVLWGEDLYDGKMAVHEVGMLLGLKTIWLDPEGLIAMQGQRYPIGEIGLVKLVEKLIERGERDRDNPDVTVMLTPDYPFGELATQLIQVRRAKPSGTEDDFSLAEIVIDPARGLILRYQSFGWPQSAHDGSSDDRSASNNPPLLESYTYYDVQTNLGLTDADFDVSNAEYGYPSF